MLDPVAVTQCSADIFREHDASTVLVETSPEATSSVRTRADVDEWQVVLLPEYVDVHTPYIERDVGGKRLNPAKRRWSSCLDDVQKTRAECEASESEQLRNQLPSRQNVSEASVDVSWDVDAGPADEDHEADSVCSCVHGHLDGMPVV